MMGSGIELRAVKGRREKEGDATPRAGESRGPAKSDEGLVKPS